MSETTKSLADASALTDTCRGINDDASTNDATKKLSCDSDAACTYAGVMCLSTYDYEVYQYIVNTVQGAMNTVGWFCLWCSVFLLLELVFTANIGGVVKEATASNSLNSYV